MSLAGYPLYRDSAIHALGDVPAHWRLMRLKHVADVRPSNVDKKSYEGERPIRLCNYTDVYYKDTITSEDGFMEATASDDQIARFGLRAGDVIVTKDSETADDIAISAHVTADLPDVVCGYHLALLRPRAGMVGGFLKRLFDAAYVKAAVEVRANGLTRVGLSQYALDNLELAIPPEQEQQKIAIFLDEEAAKIDALVAEQQRLMSLLREKREAVISHTLTGGLSRNTKFRSTKIAWARCVPEEWQICRLKDVVTEIYSGGTPDTDRPEYWTDDEGVGVPFVSIADLTRSADIFSTDRRVTHVALQDKRLRTVPPDTLLYSMYASIGRVALLRVEAAINQAILALRVDSQIVSQDFFRLWLEYIEPYVLSFASSNTQANLNLGTVRGLPCVLPSLREQHEIVEYTRAQTAQIDSLLEVASRCISLLAERRAALISAAVTGQIDVRTYRPAEELVPA